MSTNNNRPEGSGNNKTSYLLDNYTVQPQSQNQDQNPYYHSSAPSITLPKGGGALKGIDEKFTVNAINGTAGLQVGLPLTPGRGGFTPSLGLSYNSGSGNSEFGLGWSLGLPSIQRKTDKRLPLYDDGSESDIFLLSGAEDLVPVLDEDGILVIEDPVVIEDPILGTITYLVRRYIPRIEGLFARIEHISKVGDNGSWWRVTTKDNIVIYYGLTADARISDPADDSRIFKWLPQISTDYKGNVQLYEYASEDRLSVDPAPHESNRLNGPISFVNKYLKRVCYCNKNPYTIEEDQALEAPMPDAMDWLMTAVFDYGDHEGDFPGYEPSLDWPCRKDPFSDFHAGFEIRTYRKCHRVLQYHSFMELGDGETLAPILVRSLDLTYANDAATELVEADYITTIIQTGYRFTATESFKRSLPPLTMAYEPAGWDATLHDVTPEDAENAPQGLTGSYQWTDLYGEGLPGILTEQSAGWFYKSNLGDGHFTPALAVAEKPSFTGLATGALQWQDLDADGRRQVVSRQPGLSGYFEAADVPTSSGGVSWEAFRAFKEQVNVDWNSPYTKILDLDGDGRPDLLLTDDTAWTWYRNEGTEGFTTGGRVSAATDEEKGPRLVLNDAIQSIFLADMNGDGMTDIVRIKNGEVAYWPNLGWGKFGAKVTMTNSPVFDRPDLFNPLYLQLADISGTGAADLVYLASGAFRAWINLAGNGWSEAYDIATLPGMEPYSKVGIMDFLGNGTGCIVWSSPLPQHAHHPMRYIDLMGGKKPYLMKSYNNGMGKTVEVTYRSSTKYYLDDKAAGTPWATRLPFPVQCISEITTTDSVNETSYTQSYTYHHGYYDHEEREFRGFGRVDTVDTDSAAFYINPLVVHEAPDADPLDQSPVLTKSWFHTGAWMREQTLIDAFEAEYYQPIAWEKLSNIAAFQFTGAAMLSQEYREANRALKGVPLRTEIYALDGTDKEDKPYAISSFAYCTKRLQQKGGNRCASFYTWQQQSLAISCERDPDDPRMVQTLTLKVDDYGNVLQSASVAYPRVTADDDTPYLVQGAQAMMHITYSKTFYTNDVIEPGTPADHRLHRLRVPYESKGYELHLDPDDYPEGLWTVDLFIGFLPDPDDALDFAITPSPTEDNPQLRLLSCTRTLFLSNDTTAILDLGTIAYLAIPYQQYTLAFTDTILDHTLNTGITRITDEDEMLGDKGGYVHTDDIAEFPQDTYPDYLPGWWAPSGTVQYSGSPATDFYSPVSFTDPWGNVTEVTYWSGEIGDLQYWLLPKTVTDALSNVSTVLEYDWRCLFPKAVKDPNNNITEMLFDDLCMPVAMAVKGKGDDTEGDYLQTSAGGDIDPDSDEDTDLQDAFWGDPAANAKDLIGRATWRCIYDLDSLPVRVAMIARELHYHVLADSEVLIRITYTDGLGRVAMHKVQAEPGLAFGLNEHNELEIVDTDTDLRWIGSGRTVYNNKGNPVLQYEPYYSTTPDFDTSLQAAAGGVSPRLFYDPLSRVRRTEMPDGSFSFTTWDSWKQTLYDANDTIALGATPVYCQWYTDHHGGTSEEQNAADKAIEHADTPTVMHLDTLARPFYTVQHNRYIVSGSWVDADPIESYEGLDILGNRLAVYDGRGLRPLVYIYNMLKGVCRQESIDSGNQFMLTDAGGQPLCHWDADERMFRTEFDALRRPVTQKVTESSTPKVLERMVYGEGQTDPQDHNLCGRLYRHYDGAGIIQVDDYDFKGNPLGNTRTFTDDGTQHPNWTTVGSITLEGTGHITSATFDALNRPLSITTPDGGITAHTFDKGGMLYSVGITGARGLTTDIVDSILYDAKGQRTKIQYENGATTTYAYDPLTYRVTEIKTTRSSDSAVLQDLWYWYDPVGNITKEKDLAQQTVYYANAVADPINDYTYDALYRLIKAEGRELVGINSPVTASDGSRSLNYAMPFINNDLDLADAAAMRPYIQYFEYDEVGNMLKMRQTVTDGTGNWTKNFTISSSTNRLTGSSIGSDGTDTDTYAYDARGNMTGGMNHLNGGGTSMSYNALNRLEVVVVNADITTYYQYDGAGQRVRKIVVDTGSSIIQMRKYMSGWEVYRKFVSSSLTLERETLHISDDTGRIAMVDTPTVDTGSTGEVQLLRYQFSNHLGTATLELDDAAAVISYEEYYPFGSTSFQSGRSAAEVSLKRYRYTGKERDEETGLNYHGARYYVPWLCRWCAVDPLEGKYSPWSCYGYGFDNPIKWTDPTGMGPDSDGIQDGDKKKDEPPKITWDATKAPVVPDLTDEMSKEINKLKEEKGDDEVRERIIKTYEKAMREIEYHKECHPMSSNNLQFYLNGVGGTKLEDYNILIKNEAFVNADQRLNRYLVAEATRAEEKLVNGESITLKVSGYAASVKPAGYQDLYYATGTSFIKATGYITVAKDKEGNSSFEMKIFKTWMDTYDFHPGLGVDYLATNLTDQQMSDLKDFGAREFEMRAYYQTNISATMGSAWFGLIDSWEESISNLNFNIKTNLHPDARTTKGY